MEYDSVAAVGDGERDVENGISVEEDEILVDAKPPLARLTSTLTVASFRDLENQQDHELGTALTQDDSHTNELSFRPVAKVDVKVRNLSVTVQTGPSFIGKLRKKAET